MTLIRLQYGTHIREADIEPGVPIVQFLSHMAREFGPGLSSAAFIMDVQGWGRVRRDAQGRNLRLEDADGKPMFMGVRVIVRDPKCDYTRAKRPLNSPCA